MTHRIAVIGAGNVGRALSRGLTRARHDVTIAVRDPGRYDHVDEAPLASVPDAVSAADTVILAIPAPALADAVPTLPLHDGQIVLDATNSVREPLPPGFETLGEFVASMLPGGVGYAKSFNTVGAEFLSDGDTAAGPVFLPVAGDEGARARATELGTNLGFDVADLGDRSAITHVEAHARLWIHLAFAAGWGRDFAFTVTRR